MDLEKIRKQVVYIIFGLLFFLIIIFIVSFFLNTGLLIKVTPEVKEIEVDNKNYSIKEKIKLNSGLHKIVIKEYGYKKYTQEIIIKRFGTTKINVTLTEKTKELITEIPNNPLLPFRITSNYNEDKEPEYQITIFTSFEYPVEERDKIKKDALKQLNNIGVNEENSVIKYFEDGE